MDRRAFLRLAGLGVALGPEAIAEALQPRIFYSIPTPGVRSPFDYGHVTQFDAVLRAVYEASIHELRTPPTWDEWVTAPNPVVYPLRYQPPPRVFA